MGIMLLTFLRSICSVASHNIPLCKSGICTPSQSYLHLASMIYTSHASLYFPWLLHIQVDEYSPFLVERKSQADFVSPSFSPKIIHLTFCILFLSLISHFYHLSIFLLFYLCLKTPQLLLFKN